LNVQMTSGGVLNATAGNQGIYLDLDSGVAIGQVTAGSSQSGYGDVAITAAGDLSGSGTITGDNITLTSSSGGIGSVSAPLHISDNGTALANGSTLGGIINASARSDIGLEQDTGDLVVGSIFSLSGDVFVNVTQGSILDSRGATPASVLSEAQIEQGW